MRVFEYLDRPYKRAKYLLNVIPLVHTPVGFIRNESRRLFDDIETERKFATFEKQTRKKTINDTNVMVTQQQHVRIVSITFKIILV